MPLLALPLTLDDDIFGHLSDITDLINVSSTSKEAYLRIRAFMGRTFHIRHLLSRFLNPGELGTFQELQRRSGLLVSGEALLFFLLRVQHQSDRLDLFLHVRYKHIFYEWVKTTHYVDEDSEHAQPPDDEYSRPEEVAKWSSLSDTSGLTKITAIDKRTSNKIVAHFSRGAPIQMILDLPTTCLMNIATNSRIYFLYPKATFQRHLSILRPHWRSVVSFIELEPYLNLGFRFMDTCWDNFLPLFPFGRRRVGDEFTYTINLYFDNEDKDVDSRLRMNSWLVYYLPEGVMDIHGIILQSSRLEEVYIVSDEPTRKRVDELVGRLADSSNIPSLESFDDELCREVLHGISWQNTQLRMTYE